jgi:uncharacterized membrane protein
VGYDRAMLILALSEAAKTTIVYVMIWFVAFPALVTGLIAVAIVQTYREWLENQEHRRQPPV